MRPVIGIAISLLIHGVLVAVLLLAPKGMTSTQVKRGEPLFVELPNIEEPAPKGNPAGRSPAPPTSPSRPAAARPSPPAPPAVRPPAPAPAPAAPPTRVAAAPPASAAPPSPPAAAAPAPPTPAPPTPAPIAEPTPAPLPTREATPTPAPSPTPTPAERAVTAPPAPSPPSPASPPSERGGDTRVAAVPSAPREPPRPDIRSALRRGAGDGAGGLTGGRGGIEGEPIPLDSQDPRFGDYLDRVRRLIRSKWGFPCADGDPHGAHCVRREGELVVEFGILKDGHVPYVMLRDSSGSINMDDFAMNAVRLASPFPPLPDSVSKKGIPIIATFRYLIREELINVLR
jgi:TonB family protein